MTASYKIYPDFALKYVHVSGHTQLSELRDLAQTYRDDPEYDPKLRQLVDLTCLTAAKARFMDVLTLRNFYLRTFGPLDTPIMVAIVAPTDMGYGISRMFTSVMLGQKLMRIKIFTQLHDAKGWLGGTFPPSLDTDIKLLNQTT